jgi:NhaC family Na+:H+ antiporter
MASMSTTVLLILCAMTFGGVMERAGMLRVIAGAVLGVARTSRSLVVATVLTSIAMNVLAADQYIALVVPGRMYAPAYRQAGLHAKHLSRALEDGGTITSALVPWNTCGAFMSTTLAVSTVAYLPYAVFNWVNPLVSITMAILGIGLASSATSATAQATATPPTPRAD